MKRFDNHAHSFFSNIRLIDSINRPIDMIKTAYKLGYAGITLTDHETVSGHVAFLDAEKELKEKGLIPEDFKCGLGNEIYLVEDRNNIEKYWHFILIAKNEIGHKALRKLSSIAWYHSFNSRGMTRVPTEFKELKAIVEEFKGSLIASSACLGNYVDDRVLKLVAAEKENNKEEIYKLKTEIQDYLFKMRELFGEDFYVEIAAGQSEDQRAFNKRIKSIAKNLGFKIIIGSDAHYLTAEDRLIHKTYLNSKEGEREVDSFYKDAHFMDSEEAYGNLKDFYSIEEFKEICENSMEIYNKIEGYDKIFRNPIIPQVSVKIYKKDYELSNELKDYQIISDLLISDNVQERYWINECLKSLKEKELWNDLYLKRIVEEADVIKTVGDKLGNCLFDYFNTFQHYIDLFWKCGSIVPPGRGSSVCFLTNFLLGITQLDPIKWNLKSYRFLNKERLELPDIDCDLSPVKRKKIFEEIRKEIGEIRLLQVCTFGTEGSRSVIASSGRGYRSEEFPEGLPIETTQYLSSLVPSSRGFTRSIKDCVYGTEEEPPIKAFVDEVNKYDGLLEVMLRLENIVNRRGEHASGVILYNQDPWETNAIMRSPNGDLTTQFSLHEAERLGDVKYDFLVTEICDKITICVELLKKNNYFNQEESLRDIYNKYLHPDALNLEDKRLWDALAEGSVLDVFQFSTGVGLNTAKQIKPKNPTQLTSANALMRLQGEKGKERPMDRYCRLKDNFDLWYKEVRDWGLTEEEIKILEMYYVPNYGVPCSQEDLMEVCIDKRIAGFSLKEANQARKIVAKKKIKEVPTLKDKFVSSCPRKEFGEYIWETIMLPQMSYS